MASIDNIPLIDFTKYLQGTSQDREDVAHAIDEGLSSVGFIYLRNYGIDQRRIDESFNWVRNRRSR